MSEDKDKIIRGLEWALSLAHRENESKKNPLLEKLECGHERRFLVGGEYPNTCSICVTDMASRYLSGYKEALDKLENPMPCGHPGRYSYTNDKNPDDGSTWFCLACEWEGLKQ